MEYLIMLGLITVSAFGETAETLVARMTNPKATWEQRAAAEDKLAMLLPREVLPLLLPHVAKGMPGGGIWNSAGREHDKQARPVWQVFYAVGRSWSAQLKKFPGDQGGDLLLELLHKAPTVLAKTHLLGDMANRWTPEAEPTLAKLLKDSKENLRVRTTAGHALILHGKENYQEHLLRFAAESTVKDRELWHDLLVDPRHKNRRGIDPRVIVLSFDLIAAEVKRTPDYIHGAYFYAIRTGSYIGQNFNPNQNDSRYQGEGRLKEAYFQDTVKNAMQWWERNKDRVMKEARETRS